MNCLQTIAESVNVFVVHKYLPVAHSQLLTFISHYLLFLVRDCSSYMYCFCSQIGPHSTIRNKIIKNKREW